MNKTRIFGLPDDLHFAARAAAQFNIQLLIVLYVIVHASDFCSFHFNSCYMFCFNFFTSKYSGCGIFFTSIIIVYFTDSITQQWSGCVAALMEHGVGAAAEPTMRKCTNKIHISHLLKTFGLHHTVTAFVAMGTRVVAG